MNDMIAIRPARSVSFRLHRPVAALALAALACGAQATERWHGIQGEGPGYQRDIDARGPDRPPSAAQRLAAQELGVEVRWNRYGAAKIMINYHGALSAPADGTPEQIARDYLASQSAVLGLGAAALQSLELLNLSPLHESPDYARMLRGEPVSTTAVPHVVLLRQNFGGIRAAAPDGLVSVGVGADGRVAFVGSTLTPDTAFSNTERLDAAGALAIAASNADMPLGEVELITAPEDNINYIEFASSVLGDVQRVRRRALATPDRSLRRVWEVILLDSSHERGNPQAFITTVDAETGQIWSRNNAVDHLADVPLATAPKGVAPAPFDPPAWMVFPAAPVPNFGGVPGAEPGDDIRQLWCWEIADEDDDGDNGRLPEDCPGPELRNVSSRVPWDALPDGTPTFTTLGNNASTANSNISPVTPDTMVIRPVAPDRTYNFAFTDAWAASACDPLSFFDPTRNFADLDAATVNLFAMHNRMHDWSYVLGFTEVNSNLQFDNYGNTGVGNTSPVPQRELDPELGSSQAGRFYPANDGAGQLGLAGRNNANQLTLFDGTPGITNQYLWQAWPGIIYPPACVDGAYEMSIIGHEYTHAISNRMTGGPENTLGSDQDGSMGESWSDLAATEYQLAYGLVPLGDENPFATAPYVTGDTEAGIRNYGMNRSPLNYSNLGYDGNGATSPHADGEVWSATQYTVRQALIDKYQAQYPYENRQLQIDCADGKISSEACPGNRRWIQLIFDGFLLQPASPSMLDARDAIIAADQLRYGGANQAELWDAFAIRGMGSKAFSAGPADRDPKPDFSSPLRADNARYTFRAAGTDGGTPRASFHVGRFEARVTPIADTDPDTPRIGDVAAFVPGHYEFIVTAPGYGASRFEHQVEAGQSGELLFSLRPNLASFSRGALASGDGASGEARELIDDTEASNWESLVSAGTASEGKGEGAFVEGRQVTVKLAQAALVTEIQVSAALHPGGQSRFTALRAFDIQACDDSTADCASDAGFSTIYESADDAFPGGPLRPKAPNLMLRSFDVPDTQASHLRIVVRDNQCTGGPLYQREMHPSGDPANDPDCDTGSNPLLAAGNFIGANPEEVRIAELQVYAEPKGEVALLAGGEPARDLNVGNKPTGVAGARGGALGGVMLLVGFGALLRRRRVR